MQINEALPLLVALIVCEWLCYTLVVELLTKSYMWQVMANVTLKAQYITGNGNVHPATLITNVSESFNHAHTKSQINKTLITHKFLIK